MWWTLKRSGGRVAAAQGTEAAVGISTDPRAILTSCCTFRAPATLIERETHAHFEARFAAISHKEVVFDLASAPGDLHLHPLAGCCVSFTHGNQGMAFLSSVRRLDAQATPEAPQQLALRLPAHISAQDLRSAPRVNSPRGGDLRLKLLAPDGRSWEPTVINLSLSGVLVEFSDEDLPTFDPGVEAGLELCLGDEGVRLSASVRRRDGPRLGLSFPSVLREGELAPPAALHRILRQLRREAPGAAPRPADSQVASSRHA